MDKLYLVLWALAWRFTLTVGLILPFIDPRSPYASPMSVFVVLAGFEYAALYLACLWAVFLPLSLTGPHLTLSATNTSKSRVDVLRVARDVGRLFLPLAIGLALYVSSRVVLGYTLYQNPLVRILVDVGTQIIIPLVGLSYMLSRCTTGRGSNCWSTLIVAPEEATEENSISLWRCTFAVSSGAAAATVATCIVIGLLLIEPSRPGGYADLLAAYGSPVHLPTHLLLGLSSAVARYSPVCAVSLVAVPALLLASATWKLDISGRRRDARRLLVVCGFSTVVIVGLMAGAIFLPIFEMPNVVAD